MVNQGSKIFPPFVQVTLVIINQLSISEVFSLFNVGLLNIFLYTQRYCVYFIFCQKVKNNNFFMPLLKFLTVFFFYKK